MDDYSDDGGSVQSGERDGLVTHIVTVQQILQTGLELLFSEERIARVKNAATNIDRFNTKFGMQPISACMLYEDLQKTTVDEARIDSPDDTSLKFFLISLHYLRKYPTEDVLESTFDISPRYISTKVWQFVKRIQAMKAVKIVWPDNLNESDVWVLTVDGTHCWIKEPGHPEFSQDKSKFSHKLNKAGKSYELGIALNGGLIWMNGPWDAGTNDIQIFRKQNGLKERLESLGKMAIGDLGYRGEPKYVSYPNPFDSKRVNKFKSRALKRHENFNCMTKVFEILAGRFRHAESKFGVAFDAVCVLCQYKLENELPLYDVLIEAVINAADDDDDDNDSTSSSNSSEGTIDGVTTRSTSEASDE
jgi:DDE superfamily endonuclease